ncbi:amidase [Pelagibacterium halotolerans]|uniref:amidase n=1 Tax=Pelagibacterium halotolerans TaxID=531813 RepID=UPI0038512E24
MKTPNTAEPHYWSATETLDALNARRIGAVEILDHYLARLSRHGDKVNAVVERDIERARAAAAEADARRAAGKAGPLDGLPMTIKDTFEVRGFKTTAGIPDLAGYRPEDDADAVARLRGAGAVIYGKTNVPVAASDHQSYNPIYGTTRNPWNPDRCVGGSSGGSAAALAAGFSALELGSDIGGSIRIPSHYCGVYGHKPTYGIVSARGHIPPAPGELSAAPLSVCGPLARSAEDLELALGLLAGPGGATANAWSLALPKARHNHLKDFRVAVWTGGYPVDDTYAALIEEFAGNLEREGASVTRLAKTPDHLEGTDALYLDMLFGVIGSGSPEAELAAYKAVADGKPAGSYEARLARATHQSLRDWAGLASRQAKLFADWEQWFSNFDVLLCPVSMNVAFPHMTEDGHGPIAQLNRTLSVSGGKRPYLDNLLWPGVATLGHLPSTVRPLDGRVDGMPAGIQIMGAQLEDHTTIRFAQLCDEAFGGFSAPELSATEA